jgi:hypothetical protein
MAGIPSPIRKWIKRYITGEGSSEIASQSPVQSVNSQTGDVTISTGGGGGGVIPSSQTVASYSSLPTTGLSEAEIWLVSGEEDVVVSTQLSPVKWRSLSDFTVVADNILDGVIDNFNDSLYDSQSLTLSDYYTGDLTKYNRQTSGSFEGSGALAGDTSGNRHIIIGNGGLNNTLSQGETAEFYINNSGGVTRPAFLYGVQSQSSWYGAWIDAQKSQIALGIDSLGGVQAAESATINTNKFYRGVLTWSRDGSHSLTVFDPADGSVVAGSISFTDGSYTSGTNGFYINSSGQSQSVFFDAARVI